MGKTQVKPPQHLSTSSKVWWKEVVSRYEFEEGHSLKLLTLAAEALDTAETARLEVTSEGVCILDRHNCAKKNPATAIQFQAMDTFVRLLKALGINEDVSTGQPGGPQVRELPS